MFVRHFAITAAAILATTVAVSSAVHAEGPVDVRVTYNPAELSTPAGRQTVIKRIQGAAYRACDDGGTSADPVAHSRCARELSSQMVAKLPSAELASRGLDGRKIASR
jgi:UrcA family protein